MQRKLPMKTGFRWFKSNCCLHAIVAELVDAPDLGSGVERRGGSIPSGRTVTGCERDYMIMSLR